MTLVNKIKLCIRSVSIKTVATRIVATVLALLTISGFIIDYMTYSKANAFSNLGSKQALGSPVLNTAAVADDWNKYETAVWGIYLSNFCIPFVDDYESAFNLSSGNGSKGRGLQAINFGTGSDVASNKVLQELTTYAINMQTLHITLRAHLTLEAAILLRTIQVVLIQMIIIQRLLLILLLLIQVELLH